MTEVTVPTAPPLATIPGVDLVRTGQWDLSTGLVTFTTGDLASAVAALDCPAVRNPILKLGHTDPRFDGEPAVGYIANMTLAAGGHTIVGDYTGMPGWLGDVIGSAYPDRSIEGCFDWTCQLGHTHPFIIDAVALLGVQHPGVGTLTSLQDVAALYGVAAAGDGAGERVAVTIHARRDTMPNPRPAKVAAAVTSEDVRRAYYQNAPWAEWICEIQLDPLQLIIVDDESGKYYRQPVAVDGEDNFTFGDKVEVRIRYEDVTAPTGAQLGDATAASTGVIAFASRAESRPGDRPGHDAPSEDAPEAQADPAETDAPSTPAASAAASTQNSPADAGAPSQEGAGMDIDPAKLREALGLQPEASDDDVKAALTEHGLAADTPTQAPSASGEDDPASESEPGDGQEGEPAGEGDAAGNEAAQHTAASSQPAAPAKPKTVTVTEDTLNELKAAAADARAARAQQLREERDRILNDAVKAGKFSPAARKGWEKYWEHQPELARAEIANLAAGLVPVSDNGEPGGEPSSDAADAEFDRMFPPTTNARS